MANISNMPPRGAKRPSPEDTVADTMAVSAELAQGNRRAPTPRASTAPAAHAGARSMSESMRSAAIAGWSIIALFFGVFGTWAISAPLNGAVVANGFIKVESNRKSVQHLDGGIVKELRVKEGDRVTAGETLIVLDDSQARAEFDVLTQQYLVLRLTEQRLRTEYSRGTELALPQDLANQSMDPDVQSIWRSQLHQFESRRAALSGQRKVIQEKIAQLQAQIEGAEAQAQAYRTQFDSVVKELEGIKPLLEKGLIARPRYLQLERQ